MSAQYDDMVTCPACCRALPTSELCECIDSDFGPLCTYGCCRRWHREDETA